MKILHKRPLCIGCNACVEAAGDYWKMDEDGKSTLKHGKKEGPFFVREAYDEEDKEKLKEAEESCPVSIIKIKS
ncbi:MAG: ferredoxin [Candidatus Nanoarchaeia archaeon]